MVASDKIEEAKNCFGSITKSGRNNYQHYDYLEVKDIFPLVRKICKKYNLKTSIKPDFNNEMFVLRITDKDDNSFEEFYVPLFLNTSGDVGKQNQDYGRSQTYAQRYLYIQAFEIAVPDEIDNRNQKMATKSNQLKKTQPQKPLKNHTKEPEYTKEDIKQAIDTVYDIIVTQGNKEFTIDRALFQLRRKYKDKPRLLQACEQSLKINQADKVET